MGKDKGLDRIIENEFLQQRKVNMKETRTNDFLKKYLSGQFQTDRKEEKKERREKRELLKLIEEKNLKKKRNII